MTGKRLLVIGSSRFIERHLLARLNDEGHHVTALVRSRQSAERLAPLSINTVVVDLASNHFFFLFAGMIRWLPVFRKEA